MQTRLPQDVESPEAGLARLAEGTHNDPHAVLGPHPEPAGDGVELRLFLPGAVRAEVLGTQGVALPARRIGHSDGFAWSGAAAALPPHYRVDWWDGDGRRC